ncbi:MAG: polysaccharide biosynthesis protein [Clostridia bacterium]|nr:polysaccharide biosynthesis protein [Clostridia bacterium]
MSRNENLKQRDNGAVSGAFSLTVSAIIVKVIGLIYKIPLSHLLGGEGMGYFNSAYTVYGLFYLLCTAGVPKAVTMLVLESREGRSRYTEKQVIKTSMRLFFILGLSLTGAFVIFSGPLATIIGSSRARATMLAVAPSVLLVSVAGVVRGYLSAGMSFLEVAVSQVLDGVGKLVFGLIFAYYGYTHEFKSELVSAFTILGVTLGALVSLVYLLIVSKIKNTEQKTEQKLSSLERKEIRKRIFGISLPITLSAAVMSIGNIIDLFIIMRRLADGGYTELEATALYGHYTTLAVPMLNFAISLITPVSVAFLPILIKGRVNSDGIYSDRARKDALSLTALLSAPLVFGISAFSSEILTMLFGKEGVSVGAPLLRLIMPALAFLSVLLVVNTSLEAAGSVRAPILSMLVGSLAKVLISYFLISNSDFGISAAPIGTVVSYALSLACSLLYALKKHRMNFPIFKTHILPYLDAALSVLCARAIYFKLLLSLNDTVALCASGMLFCVIYMILSLLCGTVSVKKIKNMAFCTKRA